MSLIHLGGGVGWLGALKEFTCFPRLPIELRCEIWKATLEPRVMEINYDLPEGFYCNNRYPIGLEICQESRNTLLPYYPLCFGTIFHPARTRFNFDLDTLYIEGQFEEDLPHLFSALNSTELLGLKYVAIDSSFNAADDEGFEFVVHLRKAMRCLKGLKELQIVFDVQIMTERTLGCGQDDHPIEIHETLPKELKYPELNIAELPSDAELEEFDLWKVKAVKPVYGWRRCPMDVDDDDFARFVTERYESEIWRATGPLGHFIFDEGDTDMDSFDGEEEDEMEMDDEDEGIFEDEDEDEDDDDHIESSGSSELTSTLSLD